MEYTNTLRVLNDFADKLISNYKDELVSEGWQTGKLYNSIKKVSVVNAALGFRITLELEDYWKYIEYGRKAGKQARRTKRPPITAIHNWIIKKKIPIKPIQLKSGKNIIPTTLQLSYMISNSILKNGFKNPVKEKPLMRKAIVSTRLDFIERIKEALVKDMIEESFPNP